MAPATCAQRHMWNLIQRQLPDAAFYNEGLWTDLPARGTPQDVLDTFAELVGHYESLRTAFARAPDGSLTQHVLRTGHFEAEIHTTGPGESPQDALRAWQCRMRHTAFDLATAPLFRAMVVLTGNTPALAAFCVSHIAADLMSMRHLIGELPRLLDARTTGRHPAPPPAARQPVEQAHYERSRKGRALLARSHDYWRRQLASAPPSLFPARRSRATGPPDPGRAGPEHYSAAMNSQAVPLALTILSRRWRVSGSAVLLTAVALLLGNRAHLPACTLRLLTANRSEPELRTAVANLHQEVPVTVPLRGEHVADIARGAFAACTTAYAHGLFDPDRAEELTRAAGRERGTPIDLSYCFNDIRNAHERRADTSTPPPAHAVRAATTATTIEPCDFEEAETFFFVVVSYRPGWLRLVADADTAALAPDEVHSFLRGVERLLVELACEPAESTPPAELATRAWPELRHSRMAMPQAGGAATGTARGDCHGHTTWQ
ncbi:condensation domain-containing protein [Streptomyces syringium]|uniref:condensation domain-containing protein n=1 Tax=Streptomyces syringium TaxID=76729 RepID=UPI00367E31E5